MEKALINSRDFIMFGLQPWDIEIGSNFKNMAEEISRHNRVLYVNRPLDRISYYKNKKNAKVQARIKSIRSGENVLAVVKQNLWAFNPRTILESINWMPPGFLYKFFNRRNSKKLAIEIKKAAADLGFENPVLLVDNDFFHGLYLKEFLQPDLFIHYIRDYLLSQDYFVKHGKISEPGIMKKADAVAANSQYLANYAGQYNSNTADIGQGCDVDDFLVKPAVVPEDIAGIQKPVIGYCGSLTSTRLDIELLQNIAAEKPEWSIVLVGPEDDRFKSSSLHQLPNVHFLGGKSPSELPAYIHAFDVCINPQLLNQMTIGNYPRKVDEYLAAGKPVVATKTETMKIFGDLSFLCEGKDEYIAALSKAIAVSNDPILVEKRTTLGKSHTWTASVEALYKLILKTTHHA
ncbi:MAG: glycosyltransferase family 1 protein [Ferruginibacter sp.]|nr:glycosyltransferase family 1 protein [Ferruginibacter sp.]